MDVPTPTWITYIKPNKYYLIAEGSKPPKAHKRFSNAGPEKWMLNAKSPDQTINTGVPTIPPPRRRLQHQHPAAAISAADAYTAIAATSTVVVRGGGVGGDIHSGSGDVGSGGRSGGGGVSGGGGGHGGAGRGGEFLIKLNHIFHFSLSNWRNDIFCLRSKTNWVSFC